MGLNVDNIKSWGIWLTALIRGCKLEPLTLSISGTTAPIFYTLLGVRFLLVET